MTLLLSVILTVLLKLVVVWVFFHSGGHWFGPTGIFVGGVTIGVNNVPGFRRNRDPMIV